MSLNGAKLPLSKGPPKRATIEDMSAAESAPTIITPHALPMFRDSEDGARGSKRKRERERMDPKKSRRPELPVTGPGKGGRVGASATQHVVQNLVRDTTRDQDVRISPYDFFPLLSQFAGSTAWTARHALLIARADKGGAGARHATRLGGSIRRRLRFACRHDSFGRFPPILIPSDRPYLVDRLPNGFISRTNHTCPFLLFSLGRRCSSTQSWRRAIRSGREVSPPVVRTTGEGRLVYIWYCLLTAVI